MSDLPGEPAAGPEPRPGPIAPMPYPVRLDVGEPAGPRNRLTAFFRIFTAIPILIVVAALRWGSSGILFLPVLLMLLFRRKYPRWWFDWNVEFLRLQSRIGSYLLLLRDEYPSTDDEQAVHVEVDYPALPAGLNRWLPLVKWLLAIPHFVVLVVLYVGAVVVAVVSWFAILITGRLPRSLFDYQVGVLRWSARVSGYAFLLVTDLYPPFSMSA